MPFGIHGSILPGGVSQVVEGHSAKTAAKLRKEVLDSIASGAELSEEQLASLSQADLKELALADERKKQEAIQAAESEATEVANADEFVATRVVDIGNGAGKQVYTGRGSTQVAAYEDLANKLTTAQENATRKIRQQNRDEKQTKAAQKQREADDRYVLEKRLASDPAGTVKELARQTFEEETAKLQRSQEAQRNFVDTHPTYNPVPENAQAMTEWVLSHGYEEFTEANLAEAFEALSKAGVLKLKDAAASTQRSSSISTNRSGAPAVKGDLDESVLYSMDMNSLRALADRQISEETQDE